MKITIEAYKNGDGDSDDNYCESIDTTAGLVHLSFNSVCIGLDMAWGLRLKIPGKGEFLIDTGDIAEAIIAAIDSGEPGGWGEFGEKTLSGDRAKSLNLIQITAYIKTHGIIPDKEKIEQSGVTIEEVLNHSGISEEEIETLPTGTKIVPKYYNDGYPGRYPDGSPERG